MRYEQVTKMYVNELNNYLKVRGLKITSNKNELFARVFSAMKNNFMPVKTAAELLKWKKI